MIHGHHLHLLLGLPDRGDVHARQRSVHPRQVERFAQAFLAHAAVRQHGRAGTVRPKDAQASGQRENTPLHSQPLIKPLLDLREGGVAHQHHGVLEVFEAWVEGVDVGVVDDTEEGPYGGMGRNGHAVAAAGGGFGGHKNVVAVERVVPAGAPAITGGNILARDYCQARMRGFRVGVAGFESRIAAGIEVGNEKPLVCWRSVVSCW